MHPEARPAPTAPNRRQDARDSAPIAQGERRLISGLLLRHTPPAPAATASSPTP